MGSGLLHEPFPAFGAGDGNLAFLLGHTDALLTLGTFEILMIPILDAGQERKIFPVFLISLVGLTGETAVHSETYQCVAQTCQNQREDMQGHKHGQQTQKKCHAQNEGIEFIGAVTADHKPLHTCFDLIAQGAQPGGKFLHRVPALFFVWYHYMNICEECNCSERKFTDCSTIQQRILEKIGGVIAFFQKICYIFKVKSKF